MTTRHQQHGIGLVELMIGLAIGLFIAAAATALSATHLQAWRATVLQARLLNDLRTACDIVTRDLRRAGAFSPSEAASDAVSFRFPGSNEPFGFRLHEGAIEMMLGTHWQALTDPTSVVVSDFSVTPTLQPIPLQAWCATACTDAGCGPQQWLRSVAVRVSGHPPGHDGVVRAVLGQVHLRNDSITGACPP